MKLFIIITIEFRYSLSDIKMESGYKRQIRQLYPDSILGQDVFLHLLL